MSTSGQSVSSLFSAQLSPASELQKLKQEQMSLQQKQQDFARTALCRSSLARRISCLFCPCISLLCSPCICFQVATNRKDCVDSTRKAIKRVTHRPPKNRWDLCCRFCIPCCAKLPDVHRANGSDYYSLPSERTDESSRTYRLLQLNNRIEALTQQRLEDMLSSSPQPQLKEQLLVNPIPEESEHSISYLRSESTEQLMKQLAIPPIQEFPNSPAEEVMR